MVRLILWKLRKERGAERARKAEDMERADEMAGESRDPDTCPALQQIYII